mmetsp:Transcript_35290/g.51857  ORF Transcript_35290/g.51857 Transcript_35290/m.51857 type:complete len:222 (+) Transcript_35290:868-1533(+)
MSSSLMEMVMSPLATGEAISMEERNCEDIFPLMEAFPSLIPFALMVTGGQPVDSTQDVSAPSCLSPSIRSAIGLSRIRGTPSRKNFPLPIHNAAAKGLMAVPALPRNSSQTSSPSIGELIGPACPVTVTAVLSSGSRSTGTFIWSRASSMYRMSSLSRRFSTRVFPLLNAARRRQRLLRDLDPGRVTVPSRLLIGFTVRASSMSASVNESCDFLMVGFALL